MKDYSDRLGTGAKYKDIECLVTGIPLPYLRKDYYTLTPLRSMDDIGGGCGMSVNFPPMQFEMETERIILKQYER